MTQVTSSVLACVINSEAQSQRDMWRCVLYFPLVMFFLTSFLLLPPFGFSTTDEDVAALSLMQGQLNAALKSASSHVIFPDPLSSAEPLTALSPAQTSSSSFQTIRSSKQWSAWFSTVLIPVLYNNVVCEPPPSSSANSDLAVVCRVQRSGAALLADSSSLLFVGAVSVDLMAALDNDDDVAFLKSRLQPSGDSSGATKLSMCISPDTVERRFALSVASESSSPFIPRKHNVANGAFSIQFPSVTAKNFSAATRDFENLSRVVRRATAFASLVDECNWLAAGTVSAVLVNIPMYSAASGSFFVLEFVTDVARGWMNSVSVLQLPLSRLAEACWPGVVAANCFMVLSAVVASWSVGLFSKLSSCCCAAADHPADTEGQEEGATDEQRSTRAAFIIAVKNMFNLTTSDVAFVVDLSIFILVFISSISTFVFVAQVNASFLWSLGGSATSVGQQQGESVGAEVSRLADTTRSTHVVGSCNAVLCVFLLLRFLSLMMVEPIERLVCPSAWRASRVLPRLQVSTRRRTTTSGDGGGVVAADETTTSTRQQNAQLIIVAVVVFVVVTVVVFALTGWALHSNWQHDDDRGASSSSSSSFATFGQSLSSVFWMMTVGSVPSSVAASSTTFGRSSHDADVLAGFFFALVTFLGRFVLLGGMVTAAVVHFVFVNSCSRNDDENTRHSPSSSSSAPPSFFPGGAGLSLLSLRLLPLLTCSAEYWRASLLRDVRVFFRCCGIISSSNNNTAPADGAATDAGAIVDGTDRGQQHVRTTRREEWLGAVSRARRWWLQRRRSAGAAANACGGESSEREASNQEEGQVRRASTQASDNGNNNTQNNTKREEDEHHIATMSSFFDDFYFSEILENIALDIATHDDRTTPHALRYSSFESFVRSVASAVLFAAGEQQDQQDEEMIDMTMLLHVLVPEVLLEMLWSRAVADASLIHSLLDDEEESRVGVMSSAAAAVHLDHDSASLELLVEARVKQRMDFLHRRQ